MDFKYNCITELTEYAKSKNKKISDLVLTDQAKEMELSEDEVYERMRSQYLIMRESVESGRRPDIKSTSGLTGGDASKVYELYKKKKTLTGTIIGGAIYRALAVSELNAAMGRIVAAPTAGSCGILPAAIITMQEEEGCSERDCVMSMFTASAVGMVIGNNASLAGASGGCQAECGSAAAMAAAAICELSGGNPDQISSAVAIALKNILGLVCDPVAGLVEIPCIKRNASGVAGAFVAAELALAEIESKIPADEVICAMKKVGDSMHSSLKETAEGGLAATPTGKELRKKVFGDEASSSSGCSGCGACK